MRDLFTIDLKDYGTSAGWLVDYWRGKDFRGLVQIPFSRH